ncbi:cold shock domain-containing protein [Mycoplasma cottewii]|uniref:Cold shock domain-containing protein n=1 Tax=Mycoplasma cottewii TaxID=51364 RepID=A0ABY5TWB2_9MOLU|nr:cold shock domain-containing protein [Mycoplasma cottewii]UWD34947.1 cold shock domain-containing protein [Mycoplasma cottewii]
MNSGTIKWFDREKGFGFIVDEVEKTDVFVYYSNINSEDIKNINSGDKVSYKLAKGQKGFEALNVSKK